MCECCYDRARGRTGEWMGEGGGKGGRDLHGQELNSLFVHHSLYWAWYLLPAHGIKKKWIEGAIAVVNSAGLRGLRREAKKRCK